MGYLVLVLFLMFLSILGSNKLFYVYEYFFITNMWAVGSINAMAFAVVMCLQIYLLWNFIKTLDFGPEGQIAFAYLIFGAAVIAITLPVTFVITSLLNNAKLLDGACVGFGVFFVSSILTCLVVRSMYNSKKDKKTSNID